MSKCIGNVVVVLIRLVLEVVMLGDADVMVLEVLIMMIMIL